MTDTTLVTAAQLATAQAQAAAIANSAKVVAPATSFKFLALFDGTRNIVSDLTVSNDAQPTSVGQLFLTLRAQGDQPNSAYSYKAGVGTPGTQAGSALNPTQQAEKTANEVYNDYAEKAYRWRQDPANVNGDITAMTVSFSRGNFTETLFGQRLFTEGLVYTDPDTGAKTTLIRPGEATITANLAISPVNTFGQGASGLPPNVLNTTSVIAANENRAGFVQADLSTSGATNYRVIAGHGDAANVYTNSIGIVYQPAYQNFLSNAGYPLPLVGPANVTGPLYIHQETATSLSTIQNVGTTTPGKLVSAGPAPITIPTADGGTVIQFENYKGDIYLIKQFGGVTASVTVIQPGGVNPRVTFTNPDPTTTTDPLGNTITRTSQGRVLQTGSKQADGAMLQINYGGNSQVTGINKIYPLAADGSRTQEDYALDGTTLTNKVVVQANGDYAATRYSNGVPVGIQTKVANPDGSNTVSQYDGSGSNLQSSLTTQRDGSYSQNVYDNNRNLTSQSNYNVATGAYTENSYSAGVLQQSLVTTQVGNATHIDSLDGPGHSLGTTTQQTFDDGTQLVTVNYPSGYQTIISTDTDRNSRQLDLPNPSNLNIQVITTRDGAGVITGSSSSAVFIDTDPSSSTFNQPLANTYALTTLNAAGMSVTSGSRTINPVDGSYLDVIWPVDAQGGYTGAPVISQSNAANPANPTSAPANTFGLNQQAQAALNSAGGTALDIKSFFDAIQQGKPLPIVASGLRLFERANPGALPFQLTGVASAVGAFISLQSFSAALARGDVSQAVVSGANTFVAGVTTFAYASGFGSVSAAVAGGAISSGVGAAATAVSEVVPYLNIANDLIHGNIGGAIGAAIGYYVGGPIGSAIGEIIGSLLFGSSPPTPWGSANAQWDHAANGGAGGIRLGSAGESGGEGVAYNQLSNLIATSGYIVSQFNSTNPNTPVGLIPQRLGSLGYALANTDTTNPGFLFTINSINPATGADANPGLRFNTDGTVASSYTGDASYFQNINQYYTSKALARQAIAPGWEVQTAKLQDANGLSNAGLSELERSANLGHTTGKPIAQTVNGVSTLEDWNPIGLDFGGDLAVSSVGSINSNRTDFNIDCTADLNTRLLGTANPQYQHKTQWLNSADPLVNQLLVWKAESIHYKNRSCSHSYLLVYSTKTHMKTTKKFSKRATNKGQNHFESKKQSDLGRKSGQNRLFTGSSSYEMCSNFTSRIP